MPVARPNAERPIVPATWVPWWFWSFGSALELRRELKLVGLHDLAADGGQRAVTARAVFQANADGQVRWLLVYA
jgi:hypothetical protein